MATHSSDPVPDRQQGEEQVPAAVVDDLLASRARRRLLQCLRDAGEPVPVDDLAAELAEPRVEGGRSADSETTLPTDRRTARADVYQRHLPRLTETGVVTFDSLLGTVEFTGGARLAARLDEES
jgi:hypothetical protein